MGEPTPEQVLCHDRLHWPESLRTCPDDLHANLDAPECRPLDILYIVITILAAW